MSVRKQADLEDMCSCSRRKHQSMARFFRQIGHFPHGTETAEFSHRWPILRYALFMVTGVMHCTFLESYATARYAVAVDPTRAPLGAFNGSFKRSSA